jgi:hypothetical protein
MKSDQAKKFNIEIINSNKNHFSTLPNFDRPDCQDKGKKTNTARRSSKNSIYEPLSINYKKNTTPPYYFYPFFSLKTLEEKKLLQPKTKK